MKKILLIMFLQLLCSTLTYAGQTITGQVTVQAQLQGLPMSLTVTDLLMNGKSENGGTPRNLTVEFGSIAALSNGAYATAPEVLQVNFNPGNSLYTIQTYTANSNQGYSTGSANFGGNVAGYWNYGAEANGLIGTNNSSYVAAMMWTCYPTNSKNINLTTGSLNNWTFFKDYYTHMGNNANGLLLYNNAIAGLSGPGVVSGRPYETWTTTWQTTNTVAISNAGHWLRTGDATGYRNIAYGTGGQYANLVSPYYSSTPGVYQFSPAMVSAGNLTAHLAIGANFQGKPAQYYRSKQVFVQIIGQ